MAKERPAEGTIVSRGNGWCRKVVNGQIIKVLMCKTCKQHPCSCNKPKTPDPDTKSPKSTPDPGDYWYNNH